MTLQVYLAVIFVLISTPVYAYSLEEQRLCMSDAFRLCLSEIPNVTKITTCMIKHRAEVSPGCRTVMDRDNRK